MTDNVDNPQDDELSHGTVGRLRNMSVSAANKVINLNPQLGMWKATGTAIAHAPNLKDLRSPVVGGENIVFDEDGHSARVAHAEDLKQDYLVRTQTQQVRKNTNTSISPSEPRTSTDKNARSELNGAQSPAYDPQTHDLEKHKVPWSVAAKHGFQAAWKFISTPTGFLITIYGLNVVAWGAMLFFLILKAAPAMNHPDNGDADSSPRKIWLEIDSQILNALFCLTAFGLAPWRFRDLWWCACWRAGWGGENGHIALKKLAKRNDDWFRMGARHGEEHLEDARPTFTGKHAPPTAPWKLDFVVWLIVFNTLFQVGMAYMMWHYNRIDRPTWGAGLFIGLGCGVSMIAGVMSWWEGRKIKIIEGPKVLVESKEEEEEGV
ncbi:hypothetical protein E4T47_01467 [Aureobasidium subglaciale]|nr:hypothetical protein E4T47_01467 [Aureobasidium subglaciale]